MTRRGRRFTDSGKCRSRGYFPGMRTTQRVFFRSADHRPSGPGAAEVKWRLTESLGRKRVNPTEIGNKEFPVVMRGYLREEVQAFLAGISDQIAARDNRIAQLDAEVARLKQSVSTAPAAPATAS